MIFLIFILINSVVMFMVSIDLRFADELELSRFCILISILSLCLFFMELLYE